MRASSILFLIIVLQSAGAVGQQPVRVGTPRTMLVATDERLREWCGSEGRYDACTLFVAYRLDASCVGRDSGWVIAATAQFTPWVLLRSVRYLPHEERHVTDVRSRVAAHLAELAAERFESPEACSRRARSESDQFAGTLRAFARDSNARLH